MVLMIFTYEDYDIKIKRKKKQKTKLTHIRWTRPSHDKLKKKRTIDNEIILMMMMNLNNDYDKLNQNYNFYGNSELNITYYAMMFINLPTLYLCIISPWFNHLSLTIAFFKSNFVFILFVCLLLSVSSQCYLN